MGNIEKEGIITLVFVNESSCMIIDRIGVIKDFRFIFFVCIGGN